MKRGGLYAPAWRSPGDADRKLGVTASNDLTGSLLPRRDGKVVPVCVHIEDNGLCTDDDEDNEKDCLVATTDNHADELTVDLDSVDQCGVHRLRSASSSSSSISGDLRGYKDSNLKTSVYDLPAELTGSPLSPVPRPRSGSTAEPHRSLVEGIASKALSAVVRSCRSPVDDDANDVDRLSTVSSPAVFVISDVKQLVMFSVERTPPCAVRLSPLSHSDQTLNR